MSHQSIRAIQQIFLSLTNSAILRIATLFIAVGSVAGATTALSQNPTPLAETPGLSKTEIEDGWISLFDGETLFGWSPVAKTSETNWKIVDGEIRVSDGQPSLLCTTTQFDNYELVLEFKGDSHTNSGVFLRTSPQPKNLQSDCFELNIAHRDDHDFPTGSLVNRVAAKKDFKTEQWNTLRASVNGKKISVWINDELAVAYTAEKPTGCGYIGLQFKSGPIAFRNIRLKPLNVSELKFDTELSQWNDDQKQDSEFSATADGELQITGGRGTLESKQTFADFVLSMKCKTNAVGLNSGIFFRSIPGEFTNGYESQIQNKFKNDDRTQPVDCGTGGIFRRVDARRVNANDGEWFTKTIIANGPQVSVWVGGYMVTDWRDERKPHTNPRKGLRTDAGTIQLQGHDPTTDILMKDFRVRELEPRKK
jgi:hypothetical protein